MQSTADLNHCAFVSLLPCNCVVLYWYFSHSLSVLCTLCKTSGPTMKAAGSHALLARRFRLALNRYLFCKITKQGISLFSLMIFLRKLNGMIFCKSVMHCFISNFIIFVENFFNKLKIFVKSTLSILIKYSEYIHATGLHLIAD